MIELLTGFGFSAPLLLAGIPVAVGLLVYAYLKRGRGDRRPVATILLLQKLKSTMAARKTFIPPPRFFFELLLFLLLGLAAAGMYRKGPDERVAVLLDNSLSMMAQGGTGESRFELARRDCRSFLGSLSERTRVALYVTSPGLRQVKEELLTGDEASSALESISPVYAPDALESSLGKLVQDPRYDRVVGWSDKSMAAPNTRIQLRTQIAAGSGNIAIRDVRSESRAEKGTVLVAEVGSFAQRDTQVRVTFTAYTSVAGSMTPAKAGEQIVALTAGAVKTVELPIGSLNASGFSAHLEVPASAVGANSLLEDDTAYLATAASSNRLTVVSTLSAAALGVQRLHAFDSIVMTPAQYAAAGSHEGITIFHRTVPPGLPEGNSLFVLPPPRSQLGGDLVQGEIEVTHWMESHPIVNYLNVPLLSLRSLVPLRKPDWAQELIASTQGVAAFVGEYRSHRYVGLGFEIFPYEGKREPVLSILLLNILKWLSGTALSSGYEPAPYVMPADRGITAARYLAGGKTGELPVEKNQRIAGLPGLLAITTARAESVQAVDFFDDEESNTLALRKITIPEVTVQADAAQNQNRPLMTPILWMVLGLIGLDLLALAAAARKHRGARPA